MRPPTLSTGWRRPSFDNLIISRCLLAVPLAALFAVDELPGANAAEQGPPRHPHYTRKGLDEHFDVHGQGEGLQWQHSRYKEERQAHRNNLIFRKDAGKTARQHIDHNFDHDMGKLGGKLHEVEGCEGRDEDSCRKSLECRWTRGACKIHDEIRVVQRHAHAPVIWNLSGHQQVGWKAQTEEELLHEYDEVTVEFRSNKQVATIELRLPLRDLCTQSEDNLETECDGYIFAPLPDGGCYLRRSAAEHLPNQPDVPAVDVVRNGRVKHCHVDNTVGNGKKPFQTPKRATAVLKIDPNATEDWEFFTIFVRNPVSSPEGNDVFGIQANSFVVILKDIHDKQILAWSQTAMEIKQPWVCSYSQWRRQSACTARCGGGIRHLYRERLHPPPVEIDPALLVKCDEETIATEECNRHICNMDCHLSDWIRWADGPCSSSCGGGYEVQRRRVVHGTTGIRGRHCPDWRSDERVRYKTCNEEPCEPACHAVAEDKLPAVPTPNVVVGKCSRFCGGGTRNITGLGIRKDEAFDRKQCVNTHEETCNNHACRVLDFYPSRPHDVPEINQWFDVTIIFFLKDLTETFELMAPRGFELMLPDSDRCLLVEHNMPNILSCTVREGDMQTAVFEFQTALEPERKDFPAQYSIRLWVKNPECGGSLDPKGVCRADAIDKEWKLCVKTKLPEVLSECVEGGYDYYGSEAAESLRYTARTQAHANGRLEKNYRVDDSSLRPRTDLTRAMEPGGGLVRMSWNPQKFAHRAA